VCFYYTFIVHAPTVQTYVKVSIVLSSESEREREGGDGIHSAEFDQKAERTNIRESE